MEITVTQIWASPSTLHLRCCVVGKGEKWIRFIPVHIPMEQIPSEVRASMSDEYDRETPLPGL